MRLETVLFDLWVCGSGLCLDNGRAAVTMVRKFLEISYACACDCQPKRRRR